MENKPQNEQKQPTQREQFETEIAAINLLQQIGVSFNVPLKSEEIATLNAPKSVLKKIFHRKTKSAVPPVVKLSDFHPKGFEFISYPRYGADMKINMRKMPNPDNPAEQIDYYEAEISIRPLYLATIDTIRAKRLELQLRDPELKERLDSVDVNDTYLLRYTKEICEVLAIATLNVDDVRKYSKEIALWSEFYRTHLTNQRYMKLAQVVMMMMDAQSFRASTRLILGLGTTAPREASRVAKVQSKD